MKEIFYIQFVQSNVNKLCWQNNLEMESYIITIMESRDLLQVKKRVLAERTQYERNLSKSK